MRTLQRHVDDARALNARGDLVHAEGRRALHDRVDAGAQEYPRQHVDRLVAAARCEQIRGSHAV
jgi:hypothetical protein